MSILIFSIVVIIILALVLWLIRSAPMLDGNLSWILQALAVVVAIIAIANRAGVV